MTSNLGGEAVLGSDGAIGFRSGLDARSAAMKNRDRVLTVLAEHCRPEFLNRIDSVVVFRQLTKEDLVPIVAIQIERFAARLAGLGLTLEFEDAAIHWLAEVAFDPAYGARPLRRWIESELESVIARKLLTKEIADGATLHVAVGEGALTVNP
jgi:ATP-dependent Clp protease ATP-binding subunit ClpC